MPQRIFSLLERVTDLTEVPVVALGADTRLLFLNAPSRRLLVRADGEPVVVGTSLGEAGYPPETAARLGRLIEGVFRTAEPVASEVVLPTREGDRHFRFALSALAHPDGGTGVWAVVGVGTDVTETDSALAALRESEERRQRANRDGGVSTWTYDCATGRTVLEPDYAGLLGLAPGTAPQSAAEWFEWHHPDDRAAIVEAVRRCHAGEAERLEFEFRSHGADGRTRWFLARGTIERDGDARPVRACGVTVDITERKRAEAALAASETRFAAFMAHCPAVAWLKDAQGRYEFVNPRWEQELGAAQEQACGRTGAELFGEAATARCAEHDRQVLEAGEPLNVARAEHGAGDGDRSWVTVKFPVELPDGRHVGGFALDVTELRRMRDERRAVETRMLQAQKLEGLGAMAGGVAHHFNNLLTGVLGFASLARLEPGLPPAAGEFLAEVEASARRAAELCSQLLTYAGRGSPDRVPLDPNDIARDVARLMSAALGGRAEIALAADPAAPPVLGDPAALSQVLANLVTNAVEASPPGGRVTVSTAPADAPAALGAPHLPPGRYARIDVSDAGRGLSPEARARAFEPFFTTKPQGRGLGLPAADGVARAHGGAVVLLDREGGGTVARVLLPGVSG